jgi:hypothetical protein
VPVRHPRTATLTPSGVRTPPPSRPPGVRAPPPSRPSACCQSTRSRSNRDGADLSVRACSPAELDLACEHRRRGSRDHTSKPLSRRTLQLPKLRDGLRSQLRGRGGRRAAPEGRREEEEDAAKKMRRPPALSPRFHRRRPQRRLAAAALRARMPSCKQWRDRGRDGGEGGDAWGKKRSCAAAYP